MINRYIVTLEFDAALTHPLDILDQLKENVQYLHTGVMEKADNLGFRTRLFGIDKDFEIRRPNL